MLNIKMPPSRCTIVLCIAGALLTLFIFWRPSTSGQVMTSEDFPEQPAPIPEPEQKVGPELDLEQNPVPEPEPKPDPDPEPTFYKLATLAGTDKVNHHHYECLYETGLLPYRHQPKLKVLEIGLGCNMKYGPGKSFDLWTNYFEDVQTYFLEFDQKCGETWVEKLRSDDRVVQGKARLPIMTFGDQANRTLLQQMAKDHGPWDIIVDDGGHKMVHMINSFEELWPHIAPNGTYFIEDLSCAFNSPMYGGTKSGLTESNRRTAISMVSEVFAASIKHRGLGKKLERVTCCDEMCALRAKK